MADSAIAWTRRLSVIVPTLNEAALIGATLAALVPLRERGAEVIVVDGGSGDGTAALAARWTDLVVHSAPGRGVQLHCGALAASGEVLLFLHADTLLPAWADCLIESGLAHSRQRWGFFSIAIDGPSPMLPVIARFMNMRSRLTAIATGDQALFVRRSELLAVGGVPLLPLMEDVELTQRLRARSWPVMVEAKARTSGRRWIAGGVWRTVVLMWRLRFLYWMGVSAEKLKEKYR